MGVLLRHSLRKFTSSKICGYYPYKKKNVLLNLKILNFFELFNLFVFFYYGESKDMFLGDNT